MNYEVDDETDFGGFFSVETARWQIPRSSMHAMVHDFRYSLVFPKSFSQAGFIWLKFSLLFALIGHPISQDKEAKNKERKKDKEKGVLTKR